MDILKTDGPYVDYYTDMNTLYLLLERNNDCQLGQDFNSITVVVTAYLDPDSTEAIYSWTRTYERHQINQLTYPDVLPKYNIYVDLDNYRYQVRLHFNYDTDGNAYESKATILNIDNRITTLATESISPFFQGIFKDNIRKDREVTIWFNEYQNVDYKSMDMISNPSGTIIKQIDETPGGVRVIPTEENYQNTVKYIMAHKDFMSVLTRYYPTGIPIESTLSFRFNINAVNYWIHLSGDLRDLQDPRDLQN